MNIGRHAPIRAAVSPKPLGCYASSFPTQISFLGYHQPEHSTSLSPQIHRAIRSFTRFRTQATNVDAPPTPQPLWLAISTQHVSENTRGLRRSFSSTTHSRSLIAEEVEPGATEPREDDLLSDVDEEQSSVDDPQDEERGLIETLPTDLQERHRPRPCTRITHTSDGSVRLELLLREEAPDGVHSQPLGSRPSEIVIASEPRNIHRVMRSAGRDERHRLDKAKIERMLRREGPSWLQLLRSLDVRTPALAEKLEVTALRGTKSVLDDLYQELMNTVGHGIIPEEPYTRFGHGYIRLAGQTSAIDEVRARLDKIQGHNQGLVRAIRTGTKLEVAAYEKRARRSPSLKFTKVTSTRLAREVPFPGSWTTESLQEYLTSLIKSRKPLSLRRMNQGNRKHVEDLMFQVLFRHNASRACLSWPALHDCLKYLVKHRRLKTAREFMWEMGSAGFNSTTETYNIMLHGCASEQNLASFGHYLSEMQDRGLIPNDRTWFALLHAAPTVQAQQTIARAMRRKGLHIQAAFSRDDTASFVPSSLGSFLDAGGDGLQYINIIDGLLGEKWLNEQAVGRMLESLCLRGRMMDCLKIITILLERRAIMSRKDGLHKMLRYCSKHGKVDFAVWLIVHADTEWGQQPTDHVTLQLLFEVAVSSRSYNLARVAWKYAAMSKELAYSMRLSVHNSLRLRLDSVPELHDWWRASIGTVICGKDPLSNPMLSVDEIVQEERDLFKLSAPCYHLTTMTVEAWLLDKEWLNQGLMKTATTEWMVANAIRVPLRPIKEPRRLSEMVSIAAARRLWSLDIPT